jgi:hypothetical protein
MMFLFNINGRGYVCNNFITTEEGYYVMEIVSLYFEKNFCFNEVFLYEGRNYPFRKNAYEDYHYLVECMTEDLNSIRKEDFIEPKKEGGYLRIISSSRKEYISPGRGINIKRAIGVEKK